jgi:hypothetical protein
MISSEIIRSAGLLLLVAYFPSSLSFKPSQLEAFSRPALAKLWGTADPASEVTLTP